MKKNVITIVVICLLAASALVGLYATLKRAGSAHRGSAGHAIPEPTRQSDTELADIPARPGASRTPRGTPRGARPGDESRSGSRRSVAPVTVPPRPDRPSRPAEPLPSVDAAREELPPGLSEQTPDRPAAPPGVNQPDRPPSMLAQINTFVEQSKRTAGPQAAELGRELLGSTNPLLRVAGMAVLSENDALDEEALRILAEDEDLAVGVNSLGWLVDTGHDTEAAALADLLGQRTISADDLVNMIASDRLNSSGNRAALEMLAGTLTAEEAQTLYGNISQDGAYDYSVRMKATLLMRETLDFETFRNEVIRLQSEADGSDALWQEGITRLANRIEGPVEVHTAATTLTPSDIDEMLAREYPMTLEDMAQQLEYVIDQDDAYIAPGTADRLAERLDELNELPWTEDQQVSLTRIATIAEQLPALEQSEDQAPPNMPGPPPGAE